MHFLILKIKYNYNFTFYIYCHFENLQLALATFLIHYGVCYSIGIRGDSVPSNFGSMPLTAAFIHVIIKNTPICYLSSPFNPRCDMLVKKPAGSNGKVPQMMPPKF